MYLRTNQPQSNYHFRATRLTFHVMLDMMGWIDDYKLKRTFESTDASGTYLQTTAGPQANILARPRHNPQAIFKAVLLSASSGADTKEIDGKYAIVSDRPGPIFFLTLDLAAQSVSLEPESLMPQFRMGANSKLRPTEENYVIFQRKSKKARAVSISSASNTGVSLKIQDSNRRKCDCGCITQDEKVVLEEGWGTGFRMTLV